MVKNLPTNFTGPSSSQSGEGPNNYTLNVEHLHYHADELEALAKLAASSPEVASRFIEAQDRAAQREHATYRFSIIVTSLLVVAVLTIITVFTIQVGVAVAALCIFIVLAIAFLLRVILTGEWSETSWVGGAVKAVTRALGGKPKDEASEAPGDPPE